LEKRERGINHRPAAIKEKRGEIHDEGRGSRKKSPLRAEKSVGELGEKWRKNKSFQPFCRQGKNGSGAKGEMHLPQRELGGGGSVWREIWFDLSFGGKEKNS